jgi:peptidoglycan/LPS O-acetylase OafA/YrhL
LGVISLSRLGGQSAVLGFLLISGYSIANSITRNPKKFYSRRLLRIYPLYVCAIFASLLPFLLLGSTIHSLHGEYSQPSVATVLGNLVFMEGFVVKTIDSNRLLWTLSIEFFCYLLAPIFIKLNNKELLLLIGISSLSYASFPYYFSKMSGASAAGFHYAFLSYGFGFILLLWAWLLGFYYFRNDQKDDAKVLLIALGCFLLDQNKVVSARWDIATYIMSGIILIYSPQIKPPSIIQNLLEYLGNISYPLYLFQMPVLILSFSVGVRNSFALALLVMLASVFFYHAVDVPIRLRKYQV